MIGQLRYWQKFLLIGLVLIAPLGYVVIAYLGVQSRDTSFAVKERVGVVYLRPATALLASVVDARARAVQVAAHKADRTALDSARAAASSRPSRGVDAAHAAGTTLALNAQMGNAEEPDPRRAGRTGRHPGQALAAYDGLTAGIESLIAADGNNSNMILDPDNDAYYVMDAVLNRLTLLMDASGPGGRHPDRDRLRGPRHAGQAPGARGSQGHDPDHALELRSRLCERVRQHALRRDEGAAVRAAGHVRRLAECGHRPALERRLRTAERPRGQPAGRRHAL